MGDTDEFNDLERTTNNGYDGNHPRPRSRPRGGNGGVAMLVLNTDTQHDRELMLPSTAETFTLTASELTSTKIMLNGIEPKAESDGSVEDFKGKIIKNGANRLAPSSITFLIIPSAHNKACM